jgi:hypothetical protein
MADFSQRRQLPAVRLMVTEPASQLLRASRQQPTFSNRPRSGHWQLARHAVGSSQTVTHILLGLECYCFYGSTTRAE